MDKATKKVSEYIRQKGFNLSEISRKTELPYMVLYDSLMNEKRDRDLRVDEFLRLCDHLDVDPMQFYTFEPKEIWREYRYDYNTGRKSEYVKYADGREEIFVLIDWNYQGISSEEEILRGKKGVILQVVLTVRLVVLNVNETFWAISLTSGK